MRSMSHSSIPQIAAVLRSPVLKVCVEKAALYNWLFFVAFDSYK